MPGTRRAWASLRWMHTLPAMTDPCMRAALDEARKGLSEGGIPIGAAIFRRDGTLVGSGHNRRVQHGSAIVRIRRHAAEDRVLCTLPRRGRQVQIDEEEITNIERVKSEDQ